MATPDRSVLSFALLGLIRLLQPCSGYDLRGFFAGQPMALFSDSPGSIYPALQRLERSRRVVSTIDKSTELRRRRLYRLTPKGKESLKRWLTQPIRASDVLRGMPELFLRFSYLEDALGARACETFLASLSAALDEQLDSLRDHQRVINAKLSRSARLALQSGVATYEGQAAWAKMARDEYRKANRG